MKYKPWELHMDEIWKKKRILYNLKDFCFIPYKIYLAFKIAKQPTYYPEYKRKSYVQRVFDNVLWACKYLEPNVYYNSYGLDVKGLHKIDEYMPYRQFKLDREGALYLFPEKYRFSYQILVRDKYIFSSYIAKAVGERFVPKTIAVIQENSVIIEPSKKIYSIEEFFKENKRVICKIIDGECADSVLLLDVKEENILNGKEPITISKLKRIFNGKRYIVQEVVTQHDDINRINPYCVNTIRIITIRGKSGEINSLF